MVGVDETLSAADIRAMIPQAAADKIHVMGERRGDELAAVWLAVDGYISLSAKENFGYTMADALAYGLPVILSPGHDLAYELPGAREGRFSHGWLLAEDDCRAAAQAITEWGEAVTGAGRAQSYSRRSWASARNWVADQLSFDRFADSVRQLADTSLCRPA
jgi:glycosyltransferase involved in cell wall biosynthesis